VLFLVVTHRSNSTPFENLQNFKFPAITLTSLEPYLKAGLVAQPEDTSGIIFQLDWGTKEFNSFLHHLFPTLFAHFDKMDEDFTTIPDEPDSIGLKCIDYSLPYVLLKKEYRKYAIVDDTHPTATKYKEALSGEGTNAGFRVKSIFISEYPSSPTVISSSHASFAQSHKISHSSSSPEHVVLSTPCPSNPSRSQCFYASNHNWKSGVGLVSEHSQCWNFADSNKKIQCQFHQTLQNRLRRALITLLMMALPL
jgi:hypothetical protein